MKGQKAAKRRHRNAQMPNTGITATEAKQGDFTPVNLRSATVPADDAWEQLLFQSSLPMEPGKSVDVGGDFRSSLY